MSAVHAAAGPVSRHTITLASCRDSSVWSAESRDLVTCHAAVLPVTGHVTCHGSRLVCHAAWNGACLELWSAFPSKP